MPIESKKGRNDDRLCLQRKSFENEDPERLLFLLPHKTRQDKFFISQLKYTKNKWYFDSLFVGVYEGNLLKAKAKGFFFSISSA